MVAKYLLSKINFNNKSSAFFYYYYYYYYYYKKTFLNIDFILVVKYVICMSRLRFF